MRFSRENYTNGLNTGQADEDGVEAAFEIVTDINESVRTGEWVGDCFIYTNSTNRLNYLVGDQTYTISHFDQPMYLLGYLPRDGRVYVADKDVNVISYAISLSVVEYQTLVLRGEMDSANELLNEISEDQKNKIARFLEGQGYKEMALEIATDPEHKFDLALGLNDLNIALSIAREADVEHKWKTVGDAALTAWNIVLAEECFTHANDLGSLLLLYSSSGNAEGLKKLAEQADSAGSNNIAFSCLWQLADVEACIDLLLRTNRTAEAVLFSQTYKPSGTPQVATKWRESLEKDGKGKVARMIGMPPGVEGTNDDDLFPEWDEYLKMENSSAQGPLIDVETDGHAGEDHSDEQLNGGDGPTEQAAEVDTAA